MPRRTPSAPPPPAQRAASPERDARRHVTLHDVAAEVGISAMTAWRAVNTPDKVPEKTLLRVREAVARIGYVPNLVAGGLRSSKTRLVAALVPTLSGPVFLETVEALTAELEKRGFQLMLGQSGYERSREDALISAIVGRRPDGLVLTGILHSPLARQMLQAARIPVVETWDLTDDPIDMLVGFSHEAVGTAVCRYLMGKGRRRLALIGGNDERSDRRMDAFAREAASAGLSTVPRKLVPAPATLGSGRQALGELLAGYPEIDAVFCSSDLLALGVLTEARVRGLSVPAQLAVVGFADLPFARDLDPPLTTVRIDGNRIGQIAAEFLVGQPPGERMERVVDIGFELIERASA